MRKMSSILFALVLMVGLGLATAPPVLAGTIIHVPDDYPTIQAAIDASEDGDTIMVSAGEYDAFIMEGKANISIISTEEATVTTAADYLYDEPVVIGIHVMAAVVDSININIDGINFDGTEVNVGIPFGIYWWNSTGRIAHLTVENITGSGIKVGTGVVFRTDYVLSELEITGCTISNGEMGISVRKPDSVLEAHFNNIVGNNISGLSNEVGTVDAARNWWGDNSGPYHESLNPIGSGDEVSDNVEFEPWLESELVAARTETVAYGTVDAKNMTDIEVMVTGTATVTVARYDDNPGGVAATDFTALGKYIDVYVPSVSEVTEIEIRLYYTDAELAAAGVDEELLELLWWNGDEWIECSDGGVNTTATYGYSGYMWAKMRNDTTPSLADLKGTVFGGFQHPSETNGGFCFIATAAYGTPMSGEIQILRQFRDQYLLTNPLGQAFVNFYYRLSPPIAEFITEHPGLKPMVRTGLLPAVVTSTIVVNTSPTEKIAILGLLVLITVTVVTSAMRWRRRDTEHY